MDKEEEVPPLNPSLKPSEELLKKKKNRVCHLFPRDYRMDT